MDNLTIENVMENNKAFFAFSDEQFNSQKWDDIEYISLGSGLVCPKENAVKLTQELNKISANRIKKELEENSVKDIIWRELANHECQIVGDYSDVVDLLAGYGITEQDIKDQWGSYYQDCIDNDYF
jgi:hypothetical protein|tara:strand:+ start:8163 stop:8540 length:378 start_codon:yes stop_codon:yes gene_type:complete